MIELNEIEEAASRIEGAVRRTPSVRFIPLRQTLLYDVWLKLENLQVTGSFKPRGAVNKIRSLGSKLLGNGILTASGGNHGLGVAYAASLSGVPATVYVPERANQARRDRLARWGAEVVVHGRDWDDAYVAAAAESERSGRIVVHPFNDPQIIAGQGTAGVEFLRDSDVRFDCVIVGIGGGGLIAGVAAAVKQLSPETIVIGVEPAGAASMSASLQAGRLVELSEVRSIADTLSPRSVGDLTLAAVQHYVDRIVLVEDEAICGAMHVLWNEFNLLVEPSGAAPLAVVLEGKVQLPPGSHVGLIVSGGNIDAAPAITALCGNALSKAHHS